MNKEKTTSKKEEQGMGGIERRKSGTNTTQTYRKYRQTGARSTQVDKEKETTYRTRHDKKKWSSHYITH